MMRRLKSRISALLRSHDVEKTLHELGPIPPRKVINPLISLLYSEPPFVRWKAVTLIGRIVTRLADEDMESARIIMRRLMWNLNDESGGIGWGSPEAMGEILASHPRLADEYTPIIGSYTDKESNFLEHPVLQRGLMWAIARIALSWPWKMKQFGPNLIPYLSSPDPYVRGLACRALGIIGTQAARATVEGLLKEKSEIQVYEDLKLERRRIGELAEEALQRIGPS